MYCMVWSEVMSRMARTLWNKLRNGPHAGAELHFGLTSLWNRPMAAPAQTAAQCDANTALSLLLDYNKQRTIQILSDSSPSAHTHP